MKCRLEKIDGVWLVIFKKGNQVIRFGNDGQLSLRFLRECINIALVNFRNRGVAAEREEIKDALVSELRRHLENASNTN